jgi:hypothetical protein
LSGDARGAWRRAIRWLHRAFEEDSEFKEASWDRVAPRPGRETSRADEAKVARVVDAWHALSDDEKRQTLIRLGYSRRSQLEAFGLD